MRPAGPAAGPNPARRHREPTPAPLPGAGHASRPQPRVAGGDASSARASPAIDGYGFLWCKAGRDVVVEDALELLGDVVAPQRRQQPAVHVDRRLGLLKGAGERDADVGVLALARPVDDAAHDRDPEVFDPRVLPAPFGHALLDVALHFFGQLLEVCAGGAAAAGAGGHLGRKGAQSRDCRICWHTRTSSVRSPPGRGVSDTRMVSPIPSASRIARPAVLATMPFMPMPASVKPRCSG